MAKKKQLKQEKPVSIEKMLDAAHLSPKPRSVE